VAQAQPPYHKKNLREKLLRETARLIAREGVGGVSMRKLSERLAISRMAAYHHFADKEALLAAAGQDGFRRLVAKLQDAASASGPAATRLRAGLRAYLDFAREESEFFRLMFSDVLDRTDSNAALGDLASFAFSSTDARAAFDTLLAAVKACQREGSLRPGEPLLLTNTFWAFTHGIACLAVGRHLKLTQEPEELLDRGLTALVAGLQDHHSGSRRPSRPR
jgi:AcrR family transcriptional regulator